MTNERHISDQLDETIRIVYINLNLENLENQRFLGLGLNLKNQKFLGSTIWIRPTMRQLGILSALSIFIQVFLIKIIKYFLRYIVKHRNSFNKFDHYQLTKTK